MKRFKTGGGRAQTDTGRMHISTFPRSSSERSKVKRHTGHFRSGLTLTCMVGNWLGRCRIGPESRLICLDFIYERVQEAVEFLFLPQGLRYPILQRGESHPVSTHLPVHLRAWRRRRYMWGNYPLPSADVPQGPILGALSFNPNMSLMLDIVLDDTFSL